MCGGVGMAQRHSGLRQPNMKEQRATDILMAEDRGIEHMLSIVEGAAERVERGQPVPPPSLPRQRLFQLCRPLPPQQAGLAEACERVEREEMGEGEHERFHAMIAQVEKEMVAQRV